MTRRSPKQKRSRETVDRIIRAAAQILVVEGPARFSTNAVAARAGVGVASVYEYFEDKEDLLVAVLERELAEVSRALEGRIPRLLEADADTALRELFTFAIEAVNERAPLVRLAVQYVYGETPLPGVARFLGQVEMLFRLLLGKFDTRPGRDPALDAYLVTHGFIGICTGVASGLPPGRTPGDVVEWLVRLARGGIVP